MDMIARHASGLKLDEVEIHVTWSLDSGFDVFATTFAQTLTSVKLTILDNYSWSAVHGKGMFAQGFSLTEYIGVVKYLVVHFEPL